MCDGRDASKVCGCGCLWRPRCEGSCCVMFCSVLLVLRDGSQSCRAESVGRLGHVGMIW